MHVGTQPTFTFNEAAQVTRRFQDLAPAVERPYDMSSDGRRFLGLVDATQAEQGTTPQIRIVVNWFQELKRLVRTK